MIHTGQRWSANCKVRKRCHLRPQLHRELHNNQRGSDPCSKCNYIIGQCVRSIIHPGGHLQSFDIVGRSRTGPGRPWIGKLPTLAGRSGVHWRGGLGDRETYREAPACHVLWMQNNFQPNAAIAAIPLADTGIADYLSVCLHASQWPYPE